jgi:chemotaxis protein CheD
MTIVHGETIAIGLGEIHVTDRPSAVLACLGLGSCIGLSGYDPVSQVGGMVHIVLPQSAGGSNVVSAKYANTAVPHLIGEMQKLGAVRTRIVWKMAGGALMSLSAGAGSLFRMGERNNEATIAALNEAGMRVSGADTGGTIGRTMRLFLETGRVTVSSAATGTKEL